MGEPDIQRFVDVFRELCAQKVEDDGLVFVVDSISAARMKEGEEYEGIRMKFNALMGSARIPVQVDIGFGDAITPSSQLIVFPTVLELPAPQLQSYPRETVVAEKFQAMVMLGIANSRMKDFFDLFTLCTQFEWQRSQSFRDYRSPCRFLNATSRGSKPRAAVRQVLETERWMG